MLNYIDNLLNRITMYRLVLYYLIAILLAAVILSVFGIISYHPLDIIFSTLVLVIISYVTNWIFSLAFRVPVSIESDFITALILALIITPSVTIHSLWFFGWAAVLAQASKYILAYKGKHIFNPAAFAVVVTAFALNQSASWWVGTMWMLPVVLIGGLLVVRKIQRFDLVTSFLISALIMIIFTSASRSMPLTVIRRVLLDSPIMFFGLIMLTEPMATPPTRNLRIMYGLLVGLLYSPRIHLGPIYSTPELALVVGNVFAYLASPKGKWLLKLKSKTKIGDDIYDFEFEPNWKVKFRPGQYLEWTVDPRSSDSRGNRRYFTLASSPTEQDVRLGVRYYENPSTFKQKLLAMKTGDKILAGQLAGDFTLPADKDEKLVFIAGGIGITPFRSMLKYLIDKMKNAQSLCFIPITKNQKSHLRTSWIRLRTNWGSKLFL